MSRISRTVQVISQGMRDTLRMPRRNRGAQLSVAVFALLAASSVHARGGCYGDCGGNGFLLLLLAPLVGIYFKFWNTRKGAPSLRKCLFYAAAAVVPALVVGFIAFALLGLPHWLGYVLMEVTMLATFALLIHPSKHVIAK